MSTLYAGPGKVYRAADSTVVGALTCVASAVAFQPEGENGPIKVNLIEDTADVATAMFGHNSHQLRDQIAEVTFKPFDNWGSLAQLFPPWLGITANSVTGIFQGGGRPFGTSGDSKMVVADVWTPDGRLYSGVRSAVIGHPSLHLGVGKGLYGDAKIVLIGDDSKALGASGFLFAANAITESGASDPGGTFTMADFIRGAWAGAWGAITGFTAIQAEEEWTIEVNAKYSPLKVQGRTYNYKLDSVEVMAKCKPFGPTHTQILGVIGAHTQGQRLGQADLVLTGPSSKTITLKNAEARGAGFEFGGTTLGTGEVGFVVAQTFNAGAPQPILVFST